MKTSNLITTRIKGGATSITCITFQRGKENFVESGGKEWEHIEDSRFKIPQDLNVGDEVKIGAKGGGRIMGRLVRVVRIDPGRIAWEPVERFELETADGPTEEDRAEEDRRKILNERAQKLRRINPTSEAWFRSLLREVGFSGFEWNYPVLNKFIIDFAWPKEKIGVEIDEPYHDFEEQAEYDRRREHALRLSGWEIIRVKYPEEPELQSKLLILNDFLSDRRKFWILQLQAWRERNDTR